MSIKANVFVEKSSVGSAKNGNQFLSLTIRGESGKQYGAKIWGYDEKLHGFIKAGIVMLIEAKEESYNGAPQLIISSAELSDVSVSKFMKKSTFNIEEMWLDLITVIDSIKEPMTKHIAEELIVKTHSEGMKAAPAAKGVHNAWYGGLLEHTLSMCKMADPIISFYSSRYDVKINRDHVIFGLLMHDLGKSVEYNYESPSYDISPLGILTNHIVLGPAWIYEQANKYRPKFCEKALGNDEQFEFERARLMHLVASHHGELEWGAPVRPSTIEAVIVHQIDMLDSKVMHVIELMQDKPKGEVKHFTEKSWVNKTQYFMSPY